MLVTMIKIKRMGMTVLIVLAVVPMMVMMIKRRMLKTT